LTTETRFPTLPRTVQEAPGTKGVGDVGPEEIDRRLSRRQCVGSL
jgi:hypothetical protein